MEEIYETGTALRFTVGKNAEGRRVFAEICSTRMRRLIIGGDDEGKMNFLRAMIAELAEKYPPSELRLILLDGPYSELSAFRSLPHLISGVAANDAAHAMAALDWAVSERKRRFSLLNKKSQEGACACNIEQYNAVCTDAEKLPRILVVAEEIERAWGREEAEKRKGELSERLEDLARYGHAVGIHLVLATVLPQPSSVTDIFKAYSHSCFVAFQMRSEASRYFLGEGGAENLRGGNELLYRSWEYPARPERMQGIWLGEDGLEKAVASAKDRFAAPRLYADAVFADGGDR